MAPSSKVPALTEFDLNKRTLAGSVRAIARALPLVGLCPVLIVQAAPAPAPGDGSGITEEILVVGEYLSRDQVNSVKTPTPVLNVPQSLTIISAAQIDEQAFNSLADIVDYTPGVTNSQGEGHRDSIVFRGVRSTADFYVDGARDDVQYYRPLYNLEQIEILRGPNALLFGRGGTGGILNRVTKKARIGESFTGVSAGAGTFGDYSVAVDTNIHTGDRSAIRLNAFYENLDNHRDFFDGERLGFNPTARFELTPSTTLDVSWEYIDHERFIDRGVPTDESGEPIDAFEDTVFGDASDNFTSLDANVLRAAVQHSFSDRLKGNLSAFYGDYEKTYQNYFASDFVSASESDSGFDQIEIDGYVDNTERETFNLAANVVGEYEFGSTKHTFVAGAEYIDTSSDQDRFNTLWDLNGDDQLFLDVVDGQFNLRNGVVTDASGGVIATNTGFGDGGFGNDGFGDGFGADFNTPGTDINDRTLVDVETLSFYLQDDIAITENFHVILGARFDRFDIVVNNVDPGAGANAGIRSREDNEVSPRGGLIYKPRENISAYFSYSESFLPRSGEQFANINGDNDELDPDVFENIEFGLKWDITPALSVTAAYFESEQTSAERSDVDDGTFDVRGLEIDGFELQLKGQITEQIRIIAGYSNLEGVTDDGAELPRELPENTFSAWVNYDVNQYFGFGLGVTYQDESFASDFDIGDDQSVEPTLPSYTRIDAAAYYNISDKVRLQLNVENLTDELYYPNSHTDFNVTVGQSINARLSLLAKF